MTCCIPCVQQRHFIDVLKLISQVSYLGLKNGPQVVITWSLHTPETANFIIKQKSGTTLIMIKWDGPTESGFTVFKDWWWRGRHTYIMQTLQTHNNHRIVPILFSSFAEHSIQVTLLSKKIVDDISTCFLSKSFGQSKGLFQNQSRQHSLFFIWFTCS